MKRRSLSLHGHSSALTVRVCCRGHVAEAALEVGAGRPVQVPSFGGRADQFLQQHQPGARAGHFRDGHRSIHSHHRRRPADLQQAIQVGDLWPIGLGEGRRHPMQAGDGRLHLVRAWSPATEHRLDQCGRLGNRRGVPQRAVLVGEQHDLAEGVGAGTASSVGGQGQCQQPDTLRLVGHQLDQHPGEADRFVGQVDALAQFTHGSVMARREHGVDRCQHGSQPVWHLVFVRHPVGNVRLGDLGLGPADALTDRGLGDQEHAGDVDRRQPADGAQGQRDLRLGRQRRVAAGEQQAQAVIATVSFVVVGCSAVGQQAECLLLLRRTLGLTTKAIDRLVARHRGQPGARPIGNAVPAPRVGGHDNSVVQRILGPVDVSCQADEGGQDLATLDPNDLVERIDQPASPKSMTGRTSTRPCHAPGICAAQLSASSRSLQSSR